MVSVTKAIGKKDVRRDMVSFMELNEGMTVFPDGSFHEGGLSNDVAEGFGEISVKFR